MKYVGYAVSWLVVIVLGSIFYGFALATLWGWFVVPALHAPALTVPQAIGLARREHVHLSPGTLQKGHGYRKRWGRIAYVIRCSGHCTAALAHDGLSGASVCVEKGQDNDGTDEIECAGALCTMPRGDGRSRAAALLRR